MTPEQGLWAVSLALIATSAALFWALRSGGPFDRWVNDSLAAL